MPSFELPAQDHLYVYAGVEIDLGGGTATHADGREVALVGQVHEFLSLLLTYPGRVLTYWQLAQSVLPELTSRRTSDRRQQSWASLDRQQQAAIKRIIHAIAYRTRVVLGERPGQVSILVNRMNLGYAMRRPLRAVRSGREAAEVSHGACPQPTLVSRAVVSVRAAHRQRSLIAPCTWSERQ